jgi:hypothetical protein
LFLYRCDVFSLLFTIILLFFVSSNSHTFGNMFCVCVCVCVCVCECMCVCVCVCVYTCVCFGSVFRIWEKISQFFLTFLYYYYYCCTGGTLLKCCCISKIKNVVTCFTCEYSSYSVKDYYTDNRLTAKIPEPGTCLNRNNIFMLLCSTKVLTKVQWQFSCAVTFWVLFNYSSFYK